MMTWIEIILYLLIALVVYTYVGYGVVLKFLVVLKRIFLSKTPEKKNNYEPLVTLVIPAYNERDFILKKVENSKSIDYPKDKLRILFITDGSTDGSEELLYQCEGVEVMHNNKRAGKAAAENRAIEQVNTPIVIFCDANTLLNRDVVKQLVKHYTDPNVGAVSGEKRISQSSQGKVSGAGEGAYWRYESALKKLDSKLYSIVGAAGELISFRTELFTPLEEDTILDDFVQTLRICEKGYKVAYEPNAVAEEMASANVKEELKRKIRIAAGGWQAMMRLKRLLLPFPNPVLTFQYISHRVLRWSLAPLALPLIFVLTLILVFEGEGNSFINIGLLICQLFFYGFSLLGWGSRNSVKKVKLFYIPYYFVMMNYAVYAGFFRWMGKAQKVTWERADRMQETGA